MRDLINLIDKSLLLEANNVKANRAGLRRNLKKLFHSFGPANLGLGTDISKSLLSNGHLVYRITIYLYNYDDVALSDKLIDKLKKAQGKYFERGLSGQIQKIVTKYIPNWQPLKSGAYELIPDQIHVMGYVDLSDHISI